MKIEVTVINYDKYKGRADVTLNSWFRLSNRFLEDPDFFDFSDQEKLAWIYVLSLASQKNSGQITLNCKHAEQVCGFSQKSIESSLEKLSKINCISYDVTGALRERNGDVLVTSSARALHNITEQDKTEQDSTKQLSPEPQKAVAVVQNVLFQISSTKQVPIKTDLVKSWAETYPKEFLELSFKEMRNWVLAQPHRAPKSDWPKFMNGWFKRGFEQYRKTLKSNPTQITVEDLEAILKKDA